MTWTQYRAALKKLGLTQAEAAAFFGVNDRTSRAWALDEAPVPEAVAKLLRYMVAHDLTTEDFP